MESNRGSFLGINYRFFAVAELDCEHFKYRVFVLSPGDFYSSVRRGIKNSGSLKEISVASSHSIYLLVIYVEKIVHKSPQTHRFIISTLFLPFFGTIVD